MLKHTLCLPSRGAGLKCALAVLLASGLTACGGGGGGSTESGPTPATLLAPSLKDAVDLVLRVGETADVSFVNSGGGQLRSCRVSPDLPIGLVVARAEGDGSCAITGVTGRSSARRSYTVTAANAGGSDTASVVIVVNVRVPRLAEIQAQELTTISPFSISIGNTGGGGLSTCTVSPQLPEGLEIAVASDGDSCQISGMPVMGSGATNYTVVAENPGGRGETTVNIAVEAISQMAPMITGAALLSVGTPARVRFSNAGGGALTGCASNPPLPSGLGIARTTDNMSCEITGMPTQAVALETYTITATNLASSAETTIDIGVAPPTLAVPQLGRLGTRVLDINVPVQMVFPNVGGGVLSECVARPALPQGLMVSVTGDMASCQIAGEPMAVAGATTYTIEGANASGSSEVAIDLTVTAVPQEPPRLSDIDARTLILGTHTRLVLANKGGIDITVCDSSPSLPLGLGVERTSDNGTCLITGVPEAETLGRAYTITATNAAGDGHGNVSFAVEAPALKPPLLLGLPATTLALGAAVNLAFNNSGGGMLSECAISPELPQGLTQSRTADRESCQISGQADAAIAATSYTITGTNPAGSSEAMVEITIEAPAQTAPMLVDLGRQALTQGELATIVFTNSGGDTITACAARPSLPAGLAVEPTGDNRSCRITGTPQVATDITTYTISATNSVSSDEGTIDLVVEPPALAAPALASVGAQALHVNRSANITLANNGGGELSACTTTTALPPGLSLRRTADNSSCEITGIPQAQTSQADYEITATNPISSSTITVTITVDPEPLAPPELASIEAQTIAIDAVVNITLANNGGGELSACAATTALPEGLVVARTADLNSCQITGAPTQVTSEAMYAITATNAAGTFSLTLTFIIEAAAADPPNLESPGSQELITNTDINIVFTNSGGGALTECAITPDLPNGLAINRTSNGDSCRITGGSSAPATLRRYTASATNAAGSSTTTLDLGIAEPALPVPEIVDIELASLLVGDRINLSLANRGGAMLSACTSAPPLPRGLSVSTSPDNGSCQITGTAETPEPRNSYIVTATNPSGNATANVIIAVEPRPLPAPDLPNVEAQRMLLNQPVNIVFANNGGGVLSACTVDKALPQGLNVSRTSDNSSCQITGVANTLTAQDSYIVTAINATARDGATIAIAVEEPPLQRPNIDDAHARTVIVGSQFNIIFSNTGGGELTLCAVDITLPQGLSLSRTPDNHSCQITGTAEATASTDTYTITATNPTGSDQARVDIAINPVPLQAPRLGTVPDITINVGDSIALTLSNTGGGKLASCTINAPLPQGLALDRNLDESSCQITGTSTAPLPQRPYIITATNSAGSYPLNVNITVEAPFLEAPMLGNAGAQAYITGSVVNYTFTNIGGGELSGCTIMPALPQGLVVNRTTDARSCQITGQPSGAATSTSHTVTATNATNSSTATIDITITLSTLARPTLVGPPSQTLTTDSVANIVFANIGGSELTACNAQPSLPPGLTLERTTDNTSCQITGQPESTAGAQSHTITATNPTGDGSTSIDISVEPPPLEAPALANVGARSLVVGSQVSIAFVNSGGGSLDGCTTSPPLPTGLELARSDDNHTCLISGAPDTAATAQPYTITAINATDSSEATITIETTQPVAPIPELEALPPQTLSEQTPGSILIRNSGGGGLTACTARPALPQGLSITPTGDSQSCQITGTPAAPEELRTYIITATNASGLNEASLDLAVQRLPLTAPMLANPADQSFTVGSFATFSFPNSGGGEISQCTINKPLPSGLSVEPTTDESTCRIRGTAQASDAQDSFEVTARNALGSSTATVNITLAPPPLASPSLIAPAPLAFVLNQAVDQLIQNSGGATLSECEAEPMLPTGLAIAVSTDTAHCRITGTATTASAAQTRTITATNAAGSHSVSAVISAIAAATALPALTDIDINYFEIGQAQSVAFDNTGGGAIIECQAQPGLPLGLTVRPSNDASSCLVSGTPEHVMQNITYTVSARNAAGSADATIQIEITTAELAAPDLIGAVLEPFLLGDQVRVTIANIGGGEISGCTSQPELPRGLSLAPTDDSRTCQLTGSADEIIPGRDYTFIAANAIGSQGANFRITINDIPLAAPALANARALIGIIGTITDFTFTNEGGAMLTACSADHALPAGLILESTADNGSCRIRGAPEETTGLTVFTITAINDAGTDTALIAIATRLPLPSPPMLVDHDAQNLLVGSHISLSLVNLGGGELSECRIDVTLPAGLGLASSPDRRTCVISGTTEQTAVARSYRITAVNAEGSGAASIEIAVSPLPLSAPRIANSEALSLHVGDTVRLLFTNSGGGQISACVAEPGLPMGLAASPTPDASACQITGDAQATALSTSYTITATNPTGSAQASVTILVEPAGLSAPRLVDADDQTVIIGSTISTVFLNIGGGQLSECAVAPDLPGGLTASIANNNATCQITGLTTAVAATTTHTATATNTAGNHSATVAITVNPRPLDPPALSAPTGEQIIAIDASYRLVLTNAGGGSLSACGIRPALPQGLAIDRTPDNSACQITGTPTALSGSGSYTITATNASGDGQAGITLRVVMPQQLLPRLIDIGAQTFIVNSNVAIFFRNTGGGGLSSCATDRALPEALSLSLTDDNRSCRITGTVTAPSPRNSYTISAANASGMGSATIEITVAEMTPEAPILEDQMARSLQLLDTVDIAFTNSGGAALSECSVSPALPQGLSVSRDRNNIGCRISGTARTVQAPVSYEVTATNAGGSGSGSVDIAIEAPQAAAVTSSRISTSGSAGPIPAAGDTITLAFQASRDLLLAPQFLIGGQLATVSQGESSAHWNATVTVNSDFVADGAGFAVQAVLPKAGAGAADVGLAATFASVSSTAADVSFATAEPFLPTPIPSLDLTIIALPVQAIISPIVFYNDGGEINSCRLDLPLPNGVQLWLNPLTSLCEITGRPLETFRTSSYTLTASNATGSGTVEFDLFVGQARPQLRDLIDVEILTMTEANVDIPNTGGSEITACRSSPALPDGLRVAPNAEALTCTITGSTLVQGIDTYEITGSNSLGSDSALIDIAVVPGVADALDVFTDPIVFGSFPLSAWKPQSEYTADGIDALVSGRIGNGLSSTLRRQSCFQYELRYDGTVSFQWRVSTEANRDFLIFYINRIEQARITGETDWARREFPITTARGELVNLRWCYEKDGSNAYARDAGYVDQLAFTGSPSNFIARTQAQTQIDLSWDLFPDAQSYRLHRAESDDRSQATEITPQGGVALAAYSDTGLTAGQSYHYWLQACGPGGCSQESLAVGRLQDIDSDDDGLIELASIGELDRIRNDLTGSALIDRRLGSISSLGCGGDGCHGYELSADIDFDASGNGETWRTLADGGYRLDGADDNDIHFDTDQGGWRPLAPNARAPFTATFDGNGHRIANLAIAAEGASLGLFGHLGAGAVIRNLGLANALIHSQGDADGARYLGALAGRAHGASITACYSTGVIASAGGDAIAGGLVGLASGGAISASHSYANVHGGPGDDKLGGLVGEQGAGSGISAAYARGHIFAGSGADSAGGLVGTQHADAAISASYALGDIAGGSGSDRGGALVGNSGGSDSASYGYGSLAGIETDQAHPPPGAAQNINDLNLTLAGASWNEAASNTLGAWDFGDGSTPPKLNYADYDGSGGVFSCTLFPANACATLLPGQDIATIPFAARQSISGDGDATLSWTTAAPASHYQVWRSLTGSLADAAQLSTGASVTSPSFTDTGLMAGQVYSYWLKSCFNSVCSPFGSRIDASYRVVDSDGNGLIEISTLTQLNGVRHNLSGSSYKETADAVPLSVGCPSNACSGYELTTDLDFDTNDNGTWSLINGSYTLDSADSDPVYFDTSTGGWVPIGSEDAPFTAIFDGQGHTIHNLAIRQRHAEKGLFGAISGNAVIRALSLVDALVTASAINGFDDAFLGALVGKQLGGIIVACSADATVAGWPSASHNRLGGLVGHSQGSIYASYSVGEVSVLGSGGTSNHLGGLVGRLVGNGLVTTTYSLANVTASTINTNAAGLVGSMDGNSRIRISYAAGGIDGRRASHNRVNALVAHLNAQARVDLSYGFGNATGGTTGTSYVLTDTTGTLISDGRAFDAADLSPEWGDGTSFASGAWDFGSEAQFPALNYGDYDVLGSLFSCNDFPMNACGTPLPHQRPVTVPVLQVAPEGSDQLGLAWSADANATHYRVFRSANADLSNPTELTEGQVLQQATYQDDNLEPYARYYYWVLSCKLLVCSEPSAVVSRVARVADADSDGLIEIASLEDLNNIRHNLLGSSLKTSPSSEGLTTGCPGSCYGYELTTNLDFDQGSNGSWTRNSDGSYSLDAADNHDVYFNVENGGWVPIPAPFQATFDGNGHTISNMATIMDSSTVGMFTQIGRGGVVRNLGLVNHLSHINTDRDGASSAGGLAASAIFNSIIATSYVTGAIAGGPGDNDKVGGLVGLMNGTVTVIACYSLARVEGGDGDTDKIGGLVGENTNARIIASYATGPVFGGGGVDFSGGLVGEAGNGSSITASYATGNIDGGNNVADVIGSLYGRLDGSSNHSYGFGSLTGGSSFYEQTLPTGVTDATGLTSTNVDPSWNSATNLTMGAWGFGDNTQSPFLLYNDYDGADDTFSCDDVPTSLCNNAIAGQPQLLQE